MIGPFSSLNETSWTWKVSCATALLGCDGGGGGDGGAIYKIKVLKKIGTQRYRQSVKSAQS